MSLAEFIAKYNGVHVDEDGYYGAQCWDLVARYAREVVGCPSLPTVTGGAAGLFTNTAPVILQYFDKVANNPNDANQIPPNGAVIVWGTTWSPPYGHTAVKTAGGVGQSMTVIEQNGNNPGGAAYIKSRNYTGVIGWLVPRKEVQQVIQDTDQEYARWNQLAIQVRGRERFGRDEFRVAAVGKTWLTAIEILSDDPEAYANTSRARLGARAESENWQGQINDLNSKVSSLTAQVNDLTTKFNELVKVDGIKDEQIRDLTAKLAVQSEDTKLLNGFGEWLTKLIARLGVKKG